MKKISLVSLTVIALSGTANATSKPPTPAAPTQTQGQGQEQGQVQGQGQQQGQSVAVGVAVGALSTSTAGAFSVSKGGEALSQAQGGNATSNGGAGGLGGNASSAGGAGGNATSSQSSSIGNNGNNGNSGSQANVNINNPATDLSRNVGAAIAPSVYNSMITCMGGVSAGGGFAGGAFSIGTSIESGPCNVRQFAILVQNDPALFKAVMCQDDIMKQAYAKIGQSCDAKAPILTTEQAKMNSSATMKLLAEQHARKAVKGF